MGDGRWGKEASLLPFPPLMACAVVTTVHLCENVKSRQVHKRGFAEEVFASGLDSGARGPTLAAYVQIDGKGAATHGRFGSELTPAIA